MFGKILIITAIITGLTETAASAQTAASAEQQVEPATIVERITASGSTIDQPQALAARLRPVPATHQNSNSGYRIQVFSDSNPRTAQAEAGRKAATISSRFPDMNTYIKYDSPYWRLRVGDFTTFEDASDALTEMKTAFPAYRREMRIVRDHINRAD